MWCGAEQVTLFINEWKERHRHVCVRVENEAIAAYLANMFIPCKNVIKFNRHLVAIACSATVTVKSDHQQMFDMKY